MKGVLARLRGARRLPTPDPFPLSDEDRRYLSSGYDASVPLPLGAEAELAQNNPRLAELREEYAALDLAVLEHSRWRESSREAFLDLRYFRGESLITWHYREPLRVTELKYYLWLRYIGERDHLELLNRLVEDGAFGCWHFRYAGHPPVSRDLLQSINEISFLDRELGIATMDQLAVLDIGAGYGRLGHRMTTALDNVTDYCCADAIPESTFLSEYYLRYRDCIPPARVITLDRVAQLEPGAFDLALNIHSFSECPLAAVEWWIGQLSRLRVPRLLIVPNEPEALLSLEADKTRRDFGPMLERAGYHLARREPVVADPAVRDLLQLHDHFHLFERLQD